MKNLIESAASAQPNARLQLHFLVITLLFASATVFSQSTSDAPHQNSDRVGGHIAPDSPPGVPGEEVQLPTDLDNFFNVIANTFETPDLCGHINPGVWGSQAWSKQGMEIESLQSHCYSNLAEELHDPKLCDYVKPIYVKPLPITVGLPESKFTPAYCRAHLFLQTGALPDPYRMEPFVQLVKQAGFGDGEVADFVYEHNPYHNPVYSAYARLRKDPVFLSRVQAARSYNEQQSASLARVANPLEYLYQMLAVDAGDPSLCGRISPNARAQRVWSLRSMCVYDIAVNQHDASLCENVLEPHTSAGAKPYPSRKDCYVEVRVVQQPGGGLTHGPEFFPSPSWFEDALRQIGDETDADSLPKPSADDYWNFIQDLADRGDPAVRAAFLKRVRALK